MRVRIHLELVKHVGPKPYLPFEYQYYLTALVYRLLAQSSTDYATYLHDRGYESGEKQFRLFTFSQLEIRKRKVTSRGIEFLGAEASWQVSSPVRDFVKYLADGLLDQETIQVGQLTFAVTGAEIVSPPSFASPMRFICLSPITVSRAAPELGRPAYYLRYQDPEFSHRLRENLLRKYLALSPDLPEDTSFEFAFDNDYIERHQGKISRLVTYRDQRILGYMAPFSLSGNPELIRFAYECGLGEKNSFGFGMIAAGHSADGNSSVSCP